jgi:hypothetical protein
MAMTLHHPPHPLSRTLCAGAGLLLAGALPGASAQGAESAPAPGATIQLDIAALLDARPVTTLTGGKLVTWNGGIDGGGRGDGYLTMAAALSNGDKEPHALPDAATFPATARHPEIILHYANDDGEGKQAHAVSGAGEFALPIPAHRYGGLFLALTSSEGESRLHCTLAYADGTAVSDVICPDYYKDIPADDPDLSYIVSDLAKWNRTNAMAEKNHHNIDCLNLHPDAGRTLLRVTVAKAAGGYLVLWGAAGVVVRP